jgi:hypothetical protein
MDDLNKFCCLNKKCSHYGQTEVEKNGACVLGKLFFAMQTPEQSGVALATR